MFAETKTQLKILNLSSDDFSVWVMFVYNARRPCDAHTCWFSPKTFQQEAGLGYIGMCVHSVSIVVSCVKRSRLPRSQADKVLKTDLGRSPFVGEAAE